MNVEISLKIKVISVKDSKFYMISVYQKNWVKKHNQGHLVILHEYVGKQFNADITLIQECSFMKD